MSVTLKAAIWAIAMILLAAGNRFGLIADSTANTMFVVIPALAVVTLGSQCRRARRNEAA